MVLGFNHNVTYKGEVFHVQTEDSGVKNPHIITLLYRGGVILCSKKTSYADILRMDNLETVVEELMKAQHKEIMRRLKSGEFDDRAFSINAPLLENYEIPSPHPSPSPRRLPSG
jgi:ketol-acid reductoisomerase